MYLRYLQEDLQRLQYLKQLSQFKPILALNSDNQNWLHLIRPERKSFLWFLATLEIGILYKMNFVLDTFQLSCDQRHFVHMY